MKKVMIKVVSISLKKLELKKAESRRQILRDGVVVELEVDPAFGSTEVELFFRHLKRVCVRVLGQWTELELFACGAHWSTLLLIRLLLLLRFRLICT